MHKEAMDYVARWSTDDPISVLDLGGRDVNGTPRPLFPNAFYWVVDQIDAPNVNARADAATYRSELEPFDLILCCEVFEHAPSWPMILWTAKMHCRRGGRLVVTCAGPGRAPHSGIDGNWRLKGGESYENIGPNRLQECLMAGGWYVEECRQVGEDVQATAVKCE